MSRNLLFLKRIHLEERRPIQSDQKIDKKPKCHCEPLIKKYVLTIDLLKLVYYAEVESRLGYRSCMNQL